MPIIKGRTSYVGMVRRHICRLQEPNRDSLVLYTRFIPDTAGFVVSQLSAATSDSSSRMKLPLRLNGSATSRGVLMGHRAHHHDGHPLGQGSGSPFGPSTPPGEHPRIDRNSLRDFQFGQEHVVQNPLTRRGFGSHRGSRRGLRAKGERPPYFGRPVTQRLTALARPRGSLPLRLQDPSRTASLKGVTRCRSIKTRTNPVRMVRHSCRLQEPNRDTLVLHARFIGDTTDYVVNQSINSTIAKDREFMAGGSRSGGAVAQSANADQPAPVGGASKTIAERCV